MPLLGKYSSELFHMFLGLHKRGCVEDKQYRSLPCFFPVGFLNTILIPETNNVLKDTLDLGEFMRWAGCWLYTACWVGIPERHDCGSVTPQVIHRGYPFRLNE